MSCKQQLASDVLPLPSAPQAQEQLEKLVEQNRQLQQQVDGLQDSLKKWSDWYANQTAKSNSPPQNEIPQQPAVTQITPVQPQPLPQALVTQQVVVNPAHTEVPATHGHTHTVERGETAMAICRKYGIKLSEFEVANPGVSPARLRVGEVLNVP